MKKELVSEIVWMRAIACIAVVVGHSIQAGFDHYFSPDSTPTMTQNILILVLLAMYFATPTFVFLSEFLISKKYFNHIPEGFIKKRAKYLLVPYIFMGFVYGIIESPELTIQTIFVESLKNIFLGDFTVYFILIIFQFYFLHVLLHKKLNKWSPKVVLPITFLINAIYLAFFNFTEPTNNPIAIYIWKTGHWLPFIGWLFYFSLGYYCGKHYNALLKYLKKRTIPLVLITIASFFIVVINKYFGIIEAISSKRIDILLYTICIILLIFHLASYINKTPKLLIILGNYSFSIYLLHKIFLHYFQPLPNMNMVLYIITSFIFSFGLSILTSYILNKFSFGKYLVGQNALIKLNRNKERKLLKKRAS